DRIEHVPLHGREGQRGRTEHRHGRGERALGPGGRRPFLPAAVHAAEAPGGPADLRRGRGRPARDHRPVHQLPAGVAVLLRHRGGWADRADRPQRPDLARPRRPHGGRRVHDGAVPPGRRTAAAPADPAGRHAGRHPRRCAGRRGRGPAARALPRRRHARPRRRRPRPGGLLQRDARRRPGPAGPRPRPAGVVHQLHRRRLGQPPDRDEVAGLHRRDLPAAHLLPAGQPGPQPHRAHLARGPRRRGGRRARRHQPGRLAGAGLRRQRCRRRAGRRCPRPRRPPGRAHRLQPGAVALAPDRDRARRPGQPARGAARLRAAGLPAAVRHPPGRRLRAGQHRGGPAGALRLRRRAHRGDALRPGRLRRHRTDALAHGARQAPGPRRERGV
ncbi:MAG: ABC transporter, permease protein 2 (cluster 4, leucine/isoleucine/valine/benzoate), partial [uncultured Blastococcus sp.]